MHMIVVVFRLSRWDSNTGTPRPPSLLPIRSATAVTKLVITPSAEFFANIGGFIGWFYYSRDEWNWTNTVKLVFAKPCQGPQKGIQKNLKCFFQTFQVRLKFIGTKHQFAEIFRYDISEAQITQNRTVLHLFWYYHLTSSLHKLITPEARVASQVHKTCQVPLVPKT